MIKRLKLWFSPAKYCRHCCLFCRYFKICEKHRDLESFKDCLSIILDEVKE